MKKCLSILICICVMLANICISCSEEEKIALSYPVDHYTQEVFISADYVFNNIGLNKPIMISENPNGDYIVLDRGDICFYRFSNNGEYISTISGPGQGPGEILQAEYFCNDKNGNIYTYEFKNKRLSIFSKDGSFIDSFRIKGQVGSWGIFVNENNEILINVIDSGYYISVYSKDGNLIKNIGEIPQTNKNEAINRHYAVGYPFEDRDHNYYVFLQFMGLVRKYDKDGILINEIILDYIPDVKDVRDFYDPIVNIKTTTEIKYLFFYQDIKFRNDNFYITTYEYPVENAYININVYILDSDFKILKKLVLPIKDKIRVSPRHFLRPEFTGDDKLILLPYNDKAEIHQFRIKAKK